MGWKQVPKDIQVYIYTAVGIATKEFLQKKSKAMDMRFYWIDYKLEQEQFLVFWRPGQEHLGYYHSKHHPTEHPIVIRPKYLHVPKLSFLQWCADLTVTVSHTVRQIPAVNTTKRYIQQVQPQHYLLEFLL